MLIQTTTAAAARCMWILECTKYTCMKCIFSFLLNSFPVVTFCILNVQSHTLIHSAQNVSLFLFSSLPIQLISTRIVCTGMCQCKWLERAQEWDKKRARARKRKESVRTFLVWYKFYGIFIPKLLQYVPIIYVVVCAFKHGEREKEKDVLDIHTLHFTRAKRN